MQILFGLILILATPTFAKTSEGNNVLNRAILANDVSAVEQTLQLRVDINSPDPNGQYAIILAARANIKDKIMQSLLKKGANPDVQNARGQTALELSLKSHSLTKMKMLINRGASPNLLNYYGDSVLTLAVSDRGDDPAEMVKLILSAKKINVNQTDRRGYTPLMLAVLRLSPSLNTVKMLVDFGAEKSIINLGRFTAFDFAEGMYDYFKSQGNARAQELSDLAEIKKLLAPGPTTEKNDYVRGHSA